MNILLVADVIAKAGRQLMEQFIPQLTQEYSLDFIVANGENLAHGMGVTAETADELFRMGVDVLTSGNHIWDKKEVFEYITGSSRLLRPANYPPFSPGKGYIIAESRSGHKIAVLNLQGRVFMPPCDDPFRIGMEIIEKIRRETPLILVDMHGEASSEKQAMGWYLDGKVTAVYGSHTHVPTSDFRVLPGGTAYVTDVGMTGPYDSIIGMEKEAIIQKFLDQMPTRFQPAKGNPIFEAMLVEADPKTGHAISIQRITRRREE